MFYEEKIINGVLMCRSMPVENNFIIGVDVGNKDEYSIAVFENDGMNRPTSEELNRAINNITNSPTYKELTEQKPESAWRTGKPEVDGVYKVIGTSIAEGEILFCRFENGIWFWSNFNKDDAAKEKSLSGNQDREWQPIKEELPDGVYQTADGYEARCVCCERYKPICCDISGIPKIGYKHYCGGSPHCCP